MYLTKKAERIPKGGERLNRRLSDILGAVFVVVAMIALEWWMLSLIP